jgi:hypothetical protein
MKTTMTRFLTTGALLLAMGHSFAADSARSGPPPAPHRLATPEKSVPQGSLEGFGSVGLPGLGEMTSTVPSSTPELSQHRPAIRTK